MMNAQSTTSPKLVNWSTILEYPSVLSSSQPDSFPVKYSSSTQDDWSQIRVFKAYLNQAPPWIDQVPNNLPH